MSRHFENRLGDDGRTRLSKLMFGEHTRELPHPTCFSLRDRFVSLADSFFAVSRLSQRCSCSQADRVQTAEHKEMCFIIFCRFIPEGSNLESMQVNKYHCSIKVFLRVQEATERSWFEPWRRTLCCIFGQDRKVTLTVPLSKQV